MARIPIVVGFIAAAAGLLGRGEAAAQEVVLETPAGKLYATLELPAANPPYPVALIHPGSGPTDRDGNSPLLPGKNDSLKLLAEGLAARGIASLRVDKRGIGKSAGALAREEDVRLESFVEDAAAWLEWLRRDGRFGKRAVIGHSEGSLIGMLAAQRAGADAFVSLAGPGRPLGQILLEQLKPQLPPAMYQEAERVVSELTAGRAVPEAGIQLPPQLTAQLFRASVQPYLISVFRYDPARELGKLNVPVLVVQGTTDLQVSPAEAEALAAANPKAQKVLVEGMNHVLKRAPADPQANIAAYSDPKLPLAEGLLAAVVRFLQASL